MVDHKWVEHERMEEIFLDKDSSGLRKEYLEMPTDKIS